MKGRLWCLRLTLLLVVSALVFSPLAVRGASLSSQPVGWNHDPSSFLLPSSPTYPAVIVYRDVRMSVASRSFEKSELLLDFANQDAAAINMMAQRQDFVSSASHSSVYQQTFDRCVGWLVIADDRGNDVSYLLSRVKNDHLAQQVAIGRALTAMPEWSHESLEAARSHAVMVLLEAIRLLEGNEAAESYAAGLSSMLPELELPQASPTKPAPSVIVVSPVSTPAEASAETGNDAGVADAPVISSLRADSKSVFFGDKVSITCTLSYEGDDELNFSWWCSRGNLVANGTDATWTAPSRPGVYEINVTVSNSLGKGDSRSVEIHVTEEDDDEGADSTGGDQEGEEPGGDDESDASPKIASLSLSADHKYLEESLGGGYSMLVSRSCVVRCIVEDPAGLEFEWTATGGGRITGSGDTVTLTVPASPGYVKITVTATNQNGEQDSASVTVYVSTCTYCF